MIDVCMLLLLGGMYLLFCGLAAWCGRGAEGNGGGEA